MCMSFLLNRLYGIPNNAIRNLNIQHHGFESVHVAESSYIHPCLSIQECRGQTSCLARGGYHETYHKVWWCCSSQNHGHCCSRWESDEYVLSLKLPIVNVLLELISFFVCFRKFGASLLNSQAAARAVQAVVIISRFFSDRVFLCTVIPVYAKLSFELCDIRPWRFLI